MRIVYKLLKIKRVSVVAETLVFTVWEHTGSNRGPSACKADALNQLSYAPIKGRQR
jgi:hypothetical protein